MFSLPVKTPPLPVNFEERHFPPRLSFLGPDVYLYLCVHGPLVSPNFHFPSDGFAARPHQHTTQRSFSSLFSPPFSLSSLGCRDLFTSMHQEFCLLEKVRLFVSIVLEGWSLAIPQPDSRPCFVCLLLLEVPWGSSCSLPSAIHVMLRNLLSFLPLRKISTVLGYISSSFPHSSGA